MWCVKRYLRTNIGYRIHWECVALKGCMGCCIVDNLLAHPTPYHLLHLRTPWQTSPQWNCSEQRCPSPNQLLRGSVNAPKTWTSTTTARWPETRSTFRTKWSCSHHLLRSRGSPHCSPHLQGRCDKLGWWGVRLRYGWRVGYVMVRDKGVTKLLLWLPNILIMSMSAAHPPTSSAILTWGRRIKLKTEDERRICKFLWVREKGTVVWFERSSYHDHTTIIIITCTVWMHPYESSDTFPQGRSKRCTATPPNTCSDIRTVSPPRRSHERDSRNLHAILPVDNRHCLRRWWAERSR